MTLTKSTDMNDAAQSNSELNGFHPIEEDDQMEYGFLDEAMDDDGEEDIDIDEDQDDVQDEVIDDDPDGLDSD